MLRNDKLNSAFRKSFSIRTRFLPAPRPNFSIDFDPNVTATTHNDLLYLYYKLSMDLYGKTLHGSGINL